MRFLGSLLSPGMWDKPVSPLCSSAFGKEKVSEVAAMALARVAASCSQPVPPRRPTQHTAAVSSGSWRLPKPGCTRCLGERVPLSRRGRLPTAAQPRSPAVLGPAGEVTGFSPPLRSNQPRLPAGAPGPHGGMTAPLTEAFQATSSFFSALVSSEAGRQQADGPGAGTGG